MHLCACLWELVLCELGFLQFYEFVVFFAPRVWYQVTNSDEPASVFAGSGFDDGTMILYAREDLKHAF